MIALETHREKAIFFGGIAISLWHIWLNTLGTMAELNASAFHFGLFAFLAMLLMPKLDLRVAIAGGVMALASAFYVLFAEQALFDRGLSYIWSDWLFSILAIGLVLELVRRAAGLFIPAVILVGLGAFALIWGLSRGTERVAS